MMHEDDQKLYDGSSLSRGDLCVVVCQVYPIWAPVIDPLTGKFLDMRVPKIAQAGDLIIVIEPRANQYTPWPASITRDFEGWAIVLIDGVVGLGERKPSTIMKSY